MIPRTRLAPSGPEIPDSVLGRLGFGRSIISTVTTVGAGGPSPIIILPTPIVVVQDENWLSVTCSLTMNCPGAIFPVLSRIDLLLDGADVLPVGICRSEIGPPAQLNGAPVDFCQGFSFAVGPVGAGAHEVSVRWSRLPGPANGFAIAPASALPGARGQGALVVHEVAPPPP